MKISVAMTLVRSPESIATNEFLELIKLDHRKDKSWLRQVVKYINTYSFDLEGQLGNKYSELFDNSREIVSQLDDYILQLQMAGMVVPNDSISNIMSLVPVKFSSMIVEFTKNGVNDIGEQVQIDKTSVEFVRELKFDYLAWYHSVIILVHIILNIFLTTSFSCR
jgi:hypothetical protein